MPVHPGTADLVEIRAVGGVEAAVRSNPYPRLFRARQRRGQKQPTLPPRPDGAEWRPTPLEQERADGGKQR
ncbi:hypothetical protein GCM10010286_16010 [Streptomyces toxytricini]|nr:hypothetical protein GCM10010286_16010 [Streptomyces toxytricini]